MASTAAEIAVRDITSDIENGWLRKELEQSRARREAYQAGLRAAMTLVAESDATAERWKEEAKWWREEHNRVHREYCDFVAMIADKFGA